MSRNKENEMTKVVLITGSSKGIGLEIAKYLADKDYQIILNSRRPIEESLLSQFESATHLVGQAIGNVSQFNDAKHMIDEVQKEYGRIDVLVNNAGITKDGLAMAMSENDFQSVMVTNLTGTFNMCRHAIKYMLKQRSGSIINISSISGILGNAGQVNYSASKAGVLGLTKSLARELASRSITVNAIAPGFINTAMTEVLSDRVKETMLSQIPLKRFGEPIEIAKAVEFLMSSPYITGHTLEVNGGMHMA